MSIFFVIEDDTVRALECDGLNVSFDPLYGTVEIDDGPMFVVGKTAWPSKKEAYDELLRMVEGAYESACLRLTRVRHLMAEDIKTSAGVENDRI